MVNCMDLQSLINQSAHLPTIPKVTQWVIANLGSDEVTTSEIAKFLETDPVLSAKLLRLANSAYFHVDRTVESVDDAIRLLGFGMVRKLVLAGGISAVYDKVPGVDLHEFWTYSLHAACTGRWLARHCASNEDLVFTTGLLHGVGQLHLHRAAPAAMAALDLQLPVLHDERMVLESQALGFNFVTVSAALTQHWNFPASLVEPLWQLANQSDVSSSSTVGSLIQLSIWYARKTLSNTPREAMLTDYPQPIGELLGLSNGWILNAQAQAAPVSGGRCLPCIPEMHELTGGMEEMLY